MMQAFRRVEYSVVVFKLADPGLYERIRQRLETDPRLTLEAKVETVFYAEQSEMLTLFIKLLGLALSIIFSIGAVVGAMITMFASVASRIGEIGTLRALGFRRSSVLTAFLGESLLLSLVGGVMGLIGAALMQTVRISTMNFQSFAELAFNFTLTPTIAAQSLLFALMMGLVGGVMGLLGAALMQTVRISTMNFQSFAELAFNFTLTPTIAAQSLLFALMMGLVGGFIPAWRAARLTIIDCLRQA
jgi:putative ABC transport system permease protein